MFVVLMLAQGALGTERWVHVKVQQPEDAYVGARAQKQEQQEPSDDEPETAQTQDHEEQQEPFRGIEDGEPVKVDAPGNTVNFVGKATGSLQSFGQGAKQMPYGDFEVFGRADTAAELTKQSMAESDKMIDQIERAEVAETKRSVYRALTRLRGAATSAFDGVARTQVGNIDEYAKTNRYLDTSKVKHLADEEADTEYWAFPKAGLLTVKKTNPELYRDILTSDEVEQRAAETEKKASLLAQEQQVQKSEKFWDDFNIKEAEVAAAHAAKHNNNGADWHFVDSFLTGAN